MICSETTGCRLFSALWGNVRDFRKEQKNYQFHKEAAAEQGNVE